MGVHWDPLTVFAVYSGYQWTYSLTRTYRMVKAYQYLIIALVIGLVGCSSSREVITETTVPGPEISSMEEDASEEFEPTTPPVEDEPEEVFELDSEEALKQRWMHLEGEQGRYMGVSTDKLYSEQLAGKEPKQNVIVAVIDSGIDIEHEDLKDVIWTNADEVSGNGIDDDKNGYVDDVYGWNFIGGPNGEQISYDTFEVTREYARLHPKYESADPDALSTSEKEEYAYYQRVSTSFEEEKAEMGGLLSNIDNALGVWEAAHGIMSDFLGTSEYSIDAVSEVQTAREDVLRAREIIMYFDSLDLEREQVVEERDKIEGYLTKGLNPEFDPRGIVADEYENSEERIYGNNSVEGPDATHGTHVAGIIAASRGNGIGMDGIAHSVQIMTIRAVPNGDERDKDVANAIRYAVDNGAQVINMSFGKGFSPYKSAVDAAVLYAESKNVLMVHAAGNDAEDNDETFHFPVPDIDGRDEPMRSWIEVGASNWEDVGQLAAVFSNYGQKSVDVFAPGVDIYSTTPDDTYESQGGTSMAAPVVSGIAALIMAYYPSFSAEEVKAIILDSAVSYKDQQVLLPGTEEEEVIEFGRLSQTGAVVNAYEALKLAGERASQ